MELSEAIEAMYQVPGQAVTHEYFEPDEYLQMPEDVYFKLSGQHVVTMRQFFTDRHGVNWTTGWSLYTGPLKE